MVTHDLRNPAGAILTALEVISDDRSGPLTPDQQEVLDLIRLSADRMLGLIDSYLDFAKMDAGYLRVNLAEADLCEVVGAGSGLARVQCHARSQALVLDLPPDPVPAHIDGERFSQVLENLLSNAVKYTPEGGRIVVQLRQEGDRAVIRVSDTGIGIPAGELPALFTKYHRVPGEATRGIRGTGLGLLIVKEIVEAHGGMVRAESEGVGGKGSTFTVIIPLGAAATERDRKARG